VVVLYYIEVGLLPAWTLRPEGRESLTWNRLVLRLVVQHIVQFIFHERQIHDAVLPVFRQEWPRMFQGLFVSH
jgi:hypothetical protein